MVDDNKLRTKLLTDSKHHRKVAFPVPETFTEIRILALLYTTYTVNIAPANAIPIAGMLLK